MFVKCKKRLIYRLFLYLQCSVNVSETFDHLHHVCTTFAPQLHHGHTGTFVRYVFLLLRSVGKDIRLGEYTALLLRIEKYSQLLQG